VTKCYDIMPFWDINITVVSSESFFEGFTLLNCLIDIPCCTGTQFQADFFTFYNRKSSRLFRIPLLRLKKKCLVCVINSSYHKGGSIASIEACTGVEIEKMNIPERRTSSLALIPGHQEGQGGHHPSFCSSTP
jgi:hypothetical protein